MQRWLVILVLAALVCAGSSFAFDGNRKGFVLGGGLGFAPVAKWSTDFDVPGILEFDESEIGAAGQILIGYAWDEHNMIVYDVNVASYNSDLFDEGLAQGIGCASWYHYFGPVGKSSFIVGGLGFYQWLNDPLEDIHSIDMGFGVLIGGGYEFARHWQVGGYLSFGKTEWLGADFNHVTLDVLVSGVAF